VTRADWVFRSVLACLVTAAVAGCSLLRGDPVRDQWENRATLPDCGSVVLTQGETLRRHAPAELACLRAALDSKSGAELTVQFPTAEGDPITEYYRVTRTGSTEIYVDATEDEFGDQEWSFAQCDQPSTVLDVNC